MLLVLFDEETRETDTFDEGMLSFVATSCARADLTEVESLWFVRAEELTVIVSLETTTTTCVGSEVEVEVEVEIEGVVVAGMLDDVAVVLVGEEVVDVDVKEVVEELVVVVVSSFGTIDVDEDVEVLVVVG